MQSKTLGLLPSKSSARRLTDGFNTLFAQPATCSCANQECFLLLIDTTQAPVTTTGRPPVPFFQVVASAAKARSPSSMQRVSHTLVPQSACKHQEDAKFGGAESRSCMSRYCAACRSCAGFVLSENMDVDDKFFLKESQRCLHYSYSASSSATFSPPFLVVPTFSSALSIPSSTILPSSASLATIPVRSTHENFSNTSLKNRTSCATSCLKSRDETRLDDVQSFHVFF